MSLYRLIIVTASILTFSARLARCDEPAGPSSDTRLPLALADHTLRDTGQRQKIVVVMADGRQLVLEVPIMAYIPNFQGLDFMSLVKKGTADPPRKQDAATQPTVGLSTPPAPAKANAPEAALQELREIIKAINKIERTAATEDTANELRTLQFRLNAVVKQMDPSL